jgi:hypothetical protein
VATAQGCVADGGCKLPLFAAGVVVTSSPLTSWTRQIARPFGERPIREITAPPGGHEHTAEISLEYSDAHLRDADTARVQLSVKTTYTNLFETFVSRC